MICRQLSFYQSTIELRLHTGNPTVCPLISPLNVYRRFTVDRIHPWIVPGRFPDISTRALFARMEIGPPRGASVAFFRRAARQKRDRRAK